MKWVTRRNLHVDRTACSWLIRRFVDADATFEFVPARTDPATVDGKTFDMRGGTFSHQGTKCTFQAMVEHYGLQKDEALVELGRIIHDADVPPSRTTRREAAGLDALMRGVQLGIPDDHAKIEVAKPIYDALFTYCQAKVAAVASEPGNPRPKLSYRRRLIVHLDDD
ncbi:MAG: chromate resistance protein [Chloroflexi bacterium]|nr:chromate resistance protein [Chloroflexota bacterium]